MSLNECKQGTSKNVINMLTPSKASKKTKQSLFSPSLKDTVKKINCEPN